jgi:hypothetical protein
MLMLVALGVMSLTSMCVIAVLVFGQKLLPVRAAIDVPLALGHRRTRNLDPRRAVVGSRTLSADVRPHHSS